MSFGIFLPSSHVTGLPESNDSINGVDTPRTGFPRLAILPCSSSDRRVRLAAFLRLRCATIYGSREARCRVLSSFLAWSTELDEKSRKGRVNGVGAEDAGRQLAQYQCIHYYYIRIGARRHDNTGIRGGMMAMHDTTPAEMLQNFRSAKPAIGETFCRPAAR